MFPAAVAGWISNQNIAEPVQSPQGAAMLENIFPTATGGITRRGTQIYAELGDGESSVTGLFSYVNGNNRRLFGSTATSIYDITLSIIEESVAGTIGGKWIDTQFATTGGVFLVIVNGEDPQYIYDGARWFPITNSGIYRLAFDAEVSPFLPGDTVTGASSSATAKVIHVTSDGDDGVLYITDISGTFTDNETITSANGHATVDGAATLYYAGIEGVPTDDLCYVWVYKNRLFYVEKESMNAWYLPIDQVGGEAKVFPLGGEFTEGGSLLFGAPWSLDTSGAGGLSEQCAFISDRGQVVVYQGLSPDDEAWQKVGTYKIGRPMGPKAWFRAGGDLIIATDIGNIPLSQAIQRDYAALSPAAVSYPIETEWNDAVASRNSAQWHQEIWPQRQMVLIALPSVEEQKPEMFVANARTGAWAKFTNWDGTCFEVFDGRLFYGSSEGRVIEAYVGGLDLGQPYTCTYVPLFIDLGTPASKKIASMARAVTRGPYKVRPQLAVMEDYVISLPPPPSASYMPPGSRWDVGIWDDATWSEPTASIIKQQWVPVSGYGNALSIALQLTSGAITPLDEEIIRIDLTYEVADIVT
ncbi:hypothetical protein NN6n1_13240 [Shinella zoogloeoides]